MAQRLARTLCPHCKLEGEISKELWQELVSPWQLAKPERVKVAVGCLECRMTGYRGRTGIYEMLPISLDMQKLIVKDAELSKIMALAHREGMQPLRLSGAAKVAQGLTTPEEIIKIAPPLE